MGMELHLLTILLRGKVLFFLVFIDCLTIEFLLGCSGSIRKPNEAMRLVVTTFIGVVFGFFLGVSFPTLSLTKVSNVSSYGSVSHSFGFHNTN